MNGSYLLDTNIIIALFEFDVGVQNRLRGAQGVFLSSVVLGELYFGANKSSRAEENTARIDRFAEGRFVLASDAQVAREYGLLKNELRLKGRPLPENDIWIAATARWHDLVLASRDNHFREVEGLKMEMW